MKKLQGSFSDVIFEDDTEITIPKYGYIVRCIFMKDYKILSPEGYTTISDCKFLKPRGCSE